MGCGVNIGNGQFCECEKYDHKVDFVNAVGDWQDDFCKCGHHKILHDDPEEE